MSVRANSLHCVVIDSLCLSLLIAAAVATSARVVEGADTRIVQIAEDDADPAIDARPSDDHVDSRLNTDDDLPSGDPSESAAGKRESMMLGMTLFERSEGDIQVKDVAATSPAWDAGIRPGDRIRSLDGVRPKRLAEWVNDMGMILRDTPDGHSVSADVDRDGESLDLRIRLPVSNVAQARDDRKAQEELARERMRANDQRQMQRGQGGGRMPGGLATNDRYLDDRIGYGGYGGYGLGGFFDDSAPPTGNGNNDDRLATSAVAQLTAVNTLGGNGTGTAQSTGGQVGIAGFQDSGAGVNAVVMVQGLPQGTYRVGIGEGGNMGTGFGNEQLNPAGLNDEGLNPALEGTGAGRNNAGNNNFNDRNRGTRDATSRNSYDPRGNQPANQQRNQQQPGLGQPINQTPNVPHGATPGAGATPGPGGGTPAGGGAAAGAGDGASLANHRNAILAQQLDPQLQNRDNAAQQPTRQGVGATNQMNQQNSGIQRGSRNPYDPHQNAQNQRRQQNGSLPSNSPQGSPFVGEIGTLQVGPDGTGRVENRFEGMTVRNLVGMSVIVESTDWQGTGGIQNDPRISQQGAGGQAGLQQRPMGQLPGQNQPLPGRTGQQQGQIGQQVVQSNAQMNGQTTRGAQGIVATGVIQLRNGGGMTGGLQQQSQQTGVQPQQRGRQGAGSPARGGNQQPGSQQTPIRPTPR